MSAALMLSFALAALAVLPQSPAQAKGKEIACSNEVFTKELYKKTRVIGFGPDGDLLISDKKYVKKIYRLLAKMELEEQEKDGGVLKKDECATLVIRQKNGKEKTFTFRGNTMYAGGKAYAIVKHNPLEKLKKLYTPDGKIPIYVECCE